MTWSDMTTAELRDRIREVADPVITAGGGLPEVNHALMRELMLMMGHGGKGGEESDLSNVCRYCEKTGNGGHGGFCPDGGNWGG